MGIIREQSMSLAAGQLTERVELQSKSVTRNSVGEELVSWATYATVWANVAPLRGAEFFAAAQLQAAADCRITIRYRSDVAVEHRVLWDGVPYDIHHVARLGKVALQLMCETGVRDGR